MSEPAPTRAEAQAMDAADPLAPLRGRFVDADPMRLYVDGNSLGRLPTATPAALAALTADWGARLVSGWADWIELPERVGNDLARTVLGAPARSVLVCDSTTVNLYKLAAAALAAAPAGRVLVTDADNFPTDRYVLQGLAETHGATVRLLTGDPLLGPSPQDVRQACASGDVALVCLSHVAYRSGALLDVEAVATAAHEAEALLLLDVSHSAGAVPVELARWGVDLAAGCTYKYLNGGPGSPAFLYVRPELQATLRSPVWGWFGQREQFAMGPGYEPMDGVARFAAGTPPILGLVAVQHGLAPIAEAGIEALRRKGSALTSLLVALHDAWLAPLGFQLGTPRDPERRGAHVSLQHPDAWPICVALIERAGVVPDFRGPDSVRFGLPAAYTRFVDVWDAADRLRGLVQRSEHRAVEAVPRRVT